MREMDSNSIPIHQESEEKVVEEREELKMTLVNALAMRAGAEHLGTQSQQYVISARGDRSPKISTLLTKPFFHFQMI